MSLEERYNRLRKAMITFGIIISLGCGFGIQQSQHALDQFKHEASLRRDQSCVQDEQKYVTAVKRVTDTYRYVRTLNREEAKNTLNQFVIRALPETEAQAKEAKAPPYCDSTKVGLKIPPPKLPKHQDFTYLLVNYKGK